MKRTNHTKTPHVIIKDDSSLHALLERVHKERERLGIRINESSFDPEATIAEWEHENAPTKTKPQKSRKQIVREFALLIIPAPDGEYLAYCPAIYGCYSRGKTPAQARKQLSENIRNYFSDLAAAGKPMPRSNGRIGKLKIAVPA